MLKPFFATLVGLLVLTAVPVSLLAKGRTVKITIKGDNLKAPIEIIDPQLLANFNVWTGPGTSSHESQGLIADWSHGAISPPPPGLPDYEISFYADFGNQEEKLVYVVSYEYDSSVRHGYVYIPGRKDKWWSLNVGSIFRQVEGNWFNVWSAWDNVALPLIEKTKATAPK
jgi:hypothetical protein